MAEKQKTEKGAARTMLDMRETFGGEGVVEGGRGWVFVREGVRKGGGSNFFDEYLEALEGRRKAPRRNHGSQLYFDTYFEREPKSGRDAEILFFHYFDTVSDFFSHPGNIGKLGLLTRQFMSHYVEEDILGDVDPKIREKLGELEDELMKACTGCGRAAVADSLRLMYNRSLSVLLTSDEAEAIGAAKFGAGGKSLTLIGSPELLAAKVRMEEIQMARRGKIHCLDESSGEVYERGPWTEEEWAQAKSRIAGEAGGNRIAIAERLRNADHFYFTQRVAYPVGAAYNFMRAMRDRVVFHCREKSEFSISQMLSRIRENEQERDREHFENHYDPEFPHIEAEAEIVPDETELDTPLRLGDGGKKGMAGGRAEAGGAEEPAGGDGDGGGGGGGSGEGRAGRRSRKVKTAAEREAEKFSKSWGFGDGRETRRLAEIMGRGNGFREGDYFPEGEAFVKSEAYPVGGEEGGAAAWIGHGDRARSEKEANALARRFLSSKKGGAVGVLCEVEGVPSVVLVRKSEDGRYFGKSVREEMVEEGGEIRGGKIVLHTGGEKIPFVPLGKISRASYSLPENRDASKGGAGGKAGAGRGLPRGGIFGILRRIRRGKEGIR